MQLLGILASMLGVAVIVFQGQPSHMLGFRFGLGDALVLISCLDWAIYTVLLRKRPKVSPLSFLLATFLVGVAAIAPLAAWEMLTRAAHTLERGRWRRVSLRGAAAFAGLVPHL
jgi:drug/metabolite transporter (DMT)-like permease